MNSCTSTLPHFTHFMLTVYLNWISADVSNRGLQIVLEAALIWKTLTFPIHMHRPFLNYILAGHRAASGQIPKQRMRTEFPRSLSGVPSEKEKKNNFLFEAEWARPLLPSFHFDAAGRLWLPHCRQTGDGSNNCLNLNEKNTFNSILFSSEGSRGRNMWFKFHEQAIQTFTLEGHNVGTKHL